MSKVAVKGNTSGTGTFTIEAPASNSNRTLSLPDTSGEMYNQGNIVGTVSQSGGVPTGAIIERGSNANGEFVKYADGTMICTLFITSATSGNNGVINWTFPSTFIGTDTWVGCTHTPNNNGSGTNTFSIFGTTGVTTTDVNFRVGNPSTGERIASKALLDLRYCAIGRWY
jgi:hypothetical protein